MEGTLIVSAGAIILYKAIKNLLYPIPIHRVDFGIWLVAATAVVNFILGYYCLLIGKKNNSLALLASGKHLLSDTWSTLGIIVGLVLLHFTGYKWIDGVVAMLFGLLIIYTGYKILRRSIAGIMDEADIKLLSHLVTLLNHNRSVNWIDLHNLRVIKYGSVLHIDCHLTVPWFLNVNEAHNEVDALSVLVRKEFGETVELFVHTDGCLPFSCKICNKENCAERKYNFEKRIDWTLENISQNKKHELI